MVDSLPYILKVYLRIIIPSGDIRLPKTGGQPRQHVWGATGSNCFPLTGEKFPQTQESMSPLATDKKSFSDMRPSIEVLYSEYNMLQTHGIHKTL